MNVDLVLFDAFPGLITLILNQQQHGTGYYKHLHRSILILSCFVFYLFVLRVLWHFCCFVKLIFAIWENYLLPSRIEESLPRDYFDYLIIRYCPPTDGLHQELAELHFVFCKILARGCLCLCWARQVEILNSWEGLPDFDQKNETPQSLNDQNSIPATRYVGHCFVGGVIPVISIQWKMESFEIGFPIEVVSSFEVHMWVWLASSNGIFDCEWEMCVGVNLESLNLRKRVATSKAWGQKTQNINFVAIFCHEVAGSLFNARLVQLAFLFLTPSFQASDLGCQPFLGDWWSFRMPDNCSQFVSQNFVSSCHGVIYATFFCASAGCFAGVFPGVCQFKWHPRRSELKWQKTGVFHSIGWIQCQVAQQLSHENCCLLLDMLSMPEILLFSSSFAVCGGGWDFERYPEQDDLQISWVQLTCACFAAWSDESRRFVASRL